MHCRELLASNCGAIVCYCKRLELSVEGQDYALGKFPAPVQLVNARLEWGSQEARQEALRLNLTQVPTTIGNNTDFSNM